MNKKNMMISRVGMMLALTCIIAPMSILISPVPLTMQMLMLFLASMILPFYEAFTVILLYIFLGAIGLPVYAGYVGGFDKFIGITGGYIWAFPSIPIFFALFKKFFGENKISHALSVFTSFTFVCGVGIIWMRYWATTIGGLGPKFGQLKYLLMVGYIPFLPFNMIVSGISASIISEKVKEVLNLK